MNIATNTTHKTTRLHQVTDVTLLQNTIQNLWALLMNIETAGTLVHTDDDEAYRRMVTGLLEQRWFMGVTADSLGISLDSRCEPERTAPTDENLSPPAAHNVDPDAGTDYLSGVADYGALSQCAPEAPPVVKEVFSSLLQSCSLLTRVIAESLMQVVSDHFDGKITLDELETYIGEHTSSITARQLFGDDKELLLAATEELDALRAVAYRALARLQQAD